MITFLLVYYVITGLATSGSLLTNKETNNSSKTDIYRVRREKQLDNIALFIRKLYKLRLISRLSMLQAIAIINTKQQ